MPSGLPGYHAIEWVRRHEATRRHARRNDTVAAHPWLDFGGPSGDEGDGTGASSMGSDRYPPSPPTFHSPPCLKVPTLLASGLGEHPWYLRQAQGGVQADGGTGRGRQGWLVTPSDCRRRGVNGGKGRVLSVGQEARGCGQHKRGNLAQSENGTQETPLSPDILPRYTPPLRLVPLRPGPSAHARRGWPLRRQEPGKTRHMQYTTPSRKGGFGEDSSFPQDPSRSHLETTLKWRTPPLPFPLPPVSTSTLPSPSYISATHDNLARPCAINCRTPGAGCTCTQ